MDNKFHINLFKVAVYISVDINKSEINLFKEAIVYILNSNVVLI